MKCEAKSIAMKKYWAEKKAKREASGLPVAKKKRGPYNVKPKTKGKWSLRARREHSIRMKERCAMEKKLKGVVKVLKEDGTIKDKNLSMIQRIKEIEIHLTEIKYQLGG